MDIAQAGRQAGRQRSPRLLLLEDDPRVRAVILRLIRGTDVATSWEEGAAKVRAHRYRGVIADIGLDGRPPRPGDRTGIDHAETAHADNGARVLILSAYFAPEWRVRGDRICAQYCLKPFASWMLLAFQDHCFGATPQHVDDDLRAAIDASIAKHRWTAALASIVLLCCEGHDIRSIAALRGTCEKTISNQVVKILETTGDDHLWQVAVRVLNDAGRLRALRK